MSTSENEIKMAKEKAELIIGSFNIMGYDAIGIGDDDLSLGKEFLIKLSNKARFPFICSNIIDEKSEKPIFKSYIIKNINGLDIGFLSLISKDFFGESDPRKKGILIQSPIESARSILKEIEKKTDLIILLSHLGYQNDLQLAKTLSGVHIILGGHTGMNLYNTPILKNTLIFQVAPKGMYIGRLDLILYNNRANFFNARDKHSIEIALQSLKERLDVAEALEIERWIQQYFSIYSHIFNYFHIYGISVPSDPISTLRNLASSIRAKDLNKINLLREKAKGDIEKFIINLRDRNEFTNRISALSEQIKDHPEVGKMIENFRLKDRSQKDQNEILQ